MSTGSHVDGDQLEVEVLLVKSSENPHGGGGHGDSVDFDAGHGDCRRRRRRFGCEF